MLLEQVELQRVLLRICCLRIVGLENWKGSSGARGKPSQVTRGGPVYIHMVEPHLNRSPGSGTCGLSPDRGDEPQSSNRCFPYIYIHIHIYIYVYTYEPFFVYMHGYICIYVCIYIHISFEGACVNYRHHGPRCV